MQENMANYLQREIKILIQIWRILFQETRDQIMKEQSQAEREFRNYGNSGQYGNHGNYGNYGNYGNTRNVQNVYENVADKGNIDNLRHEKPQEEVKTENQNHVNPKVPKQYSNPLERQANQA